MIPVVLVTGAARRIGAAIARALHAEGYRVIIHYHRSMAEANVICRELNDIRADSATAISADLSRVADVKTLAQAAIQYWGRLDALVNNAAAFYPTPFASVNEAQWDALMASNVKGPFFLVQSLAGELRQRGGRVVNIVDINTRYPLMDFSVYCLSKAGLAMATKSLALELAPQVRVNAIAPGAILWPEDNAPMSPEARAALLDAIPLKHLGDVNDIARLAAFLISSPGYLTGQTIAVDGGLGLVGKPVDPGQTTGC